MAHQDNVGWIVTHLSLVGLEGLSTFFLNLLG